MGSSSEKSEWIAAHLIYVVEVYEDGVRHVEENVVLFRNTFDGEAEHLAIEYGKTACEVNPTYIFAGIRKLIKTQVMFQPEFLLDGGVELTYSYFEVAGESELAELVRGGELTLTYIE